MQHYRHFPILPPTNRHVLTLLRLHSNSYDILYRHKIGPQECKVSCRIPLRYAGKCVVCIYVQYLRYRMRQQNPLLLIDQLLLFLRLDLPLNVVRKLISFYHNTEYMFFGHQPFWKEQIGATCRNGEMLLRRRPLLKLDFFLIYCLRKWKDQLLLHLQLNYYNWQLPCRL